MRAKPKKCRKDTLNNGGTCQEYVTKTVTKKRADSEAGFSVTELLVVCLVLLIVATLAVPSLQKALLAGETGNVYATLRTIQTMQATHYAQKGRFARIDELNAASGNTLGTPTGNDIIRAKFTFAMTPPSPTDAELRNGYEIKATRTYEGVLYEYILNQNELEQIPW
jgi:Tfp pilus assembly protein PilE